MSKGINKKRCWPWLHDWQPWLDIAGGTIMRQRLAYGVPVGDEYEAGTYVEQERHCLRCNRLQLRTVKA